MNIELWNRGVDWIEENPHEYDQQLPWTPARFTKDSLVCGSPCCFFGAIAIMSGVKRTASNIQDLKYTVGYLLEIKPFESDPLFASCWPHAWFLKAECPSSRIYLTVPTSEEAIAILRGMAKDGQVWSADEGAPGGMGSIGTI